MSQDLNKTRIPTLIGLVFALGGLVLAALLVCKHMFPELCSGSTGCKIGAIDGCKELGQSKYSKILGIPIALPGLFFYTLVTILFTRLFLSKDDQSRVGLVNILLALAVFAVVFDITLAYINFTKLVVPCLYCAYTYIATAGIFAAALFLYLKVGRTPEGIDWSPVLKTLAIQGLIAVAVTAVIVLGLMLAGRAAGGGPRGGHGGHDHSGHDHSGHDHGHSHGDGHNHGGHDNAPVPLIKAEQVGQRLTTLRSAKKFDISVAGLNNTEGKDTAYIIIQKYADLRCGHCFHTGRLLRQALKRWPGRIKVYYRHFPLDGSCNSAVGRGGSGESCIGAQASLCAADQGIFPQIYHGIFDFLPAQRPINPDTLRPLTKRVGGDWSKLLQCMGAPRTQKRLNRDIKDALKVDVRSTPTLLVQGHLASVGTPKRPYFMQLLDALVYEKEGGAAFEEFKNRKP